MCLLFKDFWLKKLNYIGSAPIQVWMNTHGTTEWMNENEKQLGLNYATNLK